MKFFKLSALLLFPMLLAACTASVSQTPTDGTVEVWAETIVEEQSEHGEIDVLVVKTHEGEFELELPGYPGETVHHTPIPGDAHAIAFFHNYWEGVSDITRVRFDGPVLLVETMAIGEPHPEVGVPCQPWELLAELAIPTDPHFIVQDNALAEDYRDDFNCVCESDEAGEYRCL